MKLDALPALGLAMACACLASGAAHAAAVVLNPARDTTLYEDLTGETGNGSGQHLFAGVTGTPAITRALLFFDVAAAIPAGSVITGVELTLHMSRTTSGPQDVEIHRVLAGWGEGLSDAGGGEGGGDQAVTDDATWLHRFYNDTFWTTPGGDFASAASSSQSVAGAGKYTWSGGLLAADVQGWLDDPAGNHGWMLRGNEADERSAKRFDSSENPTAANWPVLSIEYTPVPEPADMAGLAAGVLGLWAALRRHRSPG